MTTTIREFQRNFRKIRLRAKAGEEVVLTDADGTTFTFKAERRRPPTFGEAAGDIIGSLSTGVGDLSTNPKHLEGYGRERRRH
ncbi:MAG: hypothetical protein A3G75_04405 [Verrucomicrobia bacterium RIFCSPLOWO2_12_FULL_64_8]|nr:MAG: hypothetical protein A3G75_04405 [Verrucomicrobia bacterium RIFCSPLOWO2_12_FULL_64_8]